eukprot:CAMPEP_0114604068 /NCGR_PEP_ID=MMETSP0168-20121206/356_1 /TAXON_ID=95228 ORGANISM="Vannella sp., Strain DIVA3 517/6/12" /NCGR_SAMPLE_ID=MMETSP0168 /ASSEMBLY_ACC=CAM_ASM_000044 /LENGTH=116 /DNA_ID=CAMNT_0001814891 /DNA_START=31 /DNA_END=381 /DNA_ORIENTATION=+
MAAPSAAQIEELAVTYATLILHDDNIAISAEKIEKVLGAAKVTVAPYWGGLFEKVLGGRTSKEVDDLILGGGGAGVAIAAPAAGGAAAEDAPKEEEKKEEEEEESDGEMVGGLFDF